MNVADQRRKFQQVFGRLPVDDHELKCGLYQESWSANPETWDRAQRIVAYAERHGGDVLTFARMHWPHYWGLAMPISLECVIEDMGITDERARQLLQQIGQAVRT